MYGKGTAIGFLRRAVDMKSTRNRRAVDAQSAWGRPAADNGYSQQTKDTTGQGRAFKVGAGAASRLAWSGSRSWSLGRFPRATVAFKELLAGSRPQNIEAAFLSLREFARLPASHHLQLKASIATVIITDLKA